MTSNYKPSSLDTELLNTDAADLLETPLAREHATQKHSYPSNKSDRSGSRSTNQGDTRQLEIDNAQDNLVVEAAVAIVINGIHYAVLMASPSQLDYLAIGFLFSEGLIQYSHELLDWEVTQLTDNANFYKFIDHSNDDVNASKLVEQLQDYDIYVVELVLNQRCHQRIQDQKRQLAGRTGCGMCGITGLTQALPDLSSYAKNKPQPHPHPHPHPHQQDNAHITTYMPTLDYLLDIRAKIDAAQYTHQLTGAVHAAATLHHEQLQLFEDAGRHNALDKLIGWKLRHKADIECVVMTSRLSIELVQKSIRIQIPWLIGMSAPTSTAVRVAQRYGLGLAGFLRDNRVTYYSSF